MRRLVGLERVGPAAGPDADAVGHEFHATVDLEAEDLAGAVLHVGGVATSYDVLVNDTVIASASSMFARHRVDVAGLLRVGENDVTVRVHPLTDLLDAAPKRPRARWRTMLTDEPRLRWARTSLRGRAPGFAPGPPVTGPWRPVVLETGAGPRVSDLRLVASIIDGVAEITVDLEMAGLEASKVDVVVSGPGFWTAYTLHLVDCRATARLPVQDAELWWPHTHGTPVLYAVQVLVDGEALPLPGDGTLEADVRRVGFRSVANTSYTSLALAVNGVPVFVRGAVWTPGDLAALDQAVALGLNLVRVSGLMTYESDAFHARCDELGLLVWQDLMFVTYDYPLADDGFRAGVVDEVAAELERLAPHPSVAVVCGSAEHEQQAAMFGTPADGRAQELGELLGPLVTRSGLDVVWVASTPSGGSPVTRVDTGIAQYFGVGGYRRDLADARASRVRFAGECLAFSHAPDGPCEPGVGVPKDNGATWDFADVSEHYARQGWRTGELMSAVMAEWRRPDSGCGGGIVLWLRDLEPGAGWGLLDHTGASKPAARELAPTLQPLAVWLADEGLSGLDAHVANDRPEDVAGTVRVELLRDDGTALESAEQPVAVAARGHAVLGVEAVIGRFADVSYAYRFGPPAHAGVRATLVVDGEPDRVATWRVPPGAGPL